MKAFVLEAFSTYTYIFINEIAAFFEIYGICVTSAFHQTA